MKIRNIFFRKRRIQVHLLTIFLILLAGSCALITRFTYTKYYKDIESLSHEMIDQANTLLSEKVIGEKNQIELVAKIIKGSISSKEEVLGQVPTYTRFLINILRNDPLLTAISMATSNGDYFSVMNAEQENISHFYSHSADKLPAGSKYIVRIINESIPKETWEYISDDGSVLATETVVPVSYNFKKDPWFLSMMKSAGMQWSDELLPRGVGKYFTNQIMGITLSDVVKNQDGEILAMFSVCVNFNDLSTFIANQKIGKTGSAFLLDSKGEIKIPLDYGSTSLESLRRKLIKKGYEEFLKKGEKDLTLIKDGKKYLFSLHEVQVFSDKNEFIAILVPFSDLFEFIIKTQNRTRLMSLFVIILCGVAVYYSSKHFSNPVVYLAKQVDKIREFDFSEVPSLRSKIKEICDLESSIRAMRSALRSFGRYVPKEIVKTLMKHGADVHLGGERREITIIFSDVENFTTISESLPMEKLMAILSDYFDVISKIVLDAGGTIDKYIGDSLMAFWGAPIKIQDHGEKACLACLQCLAAIKSQKKWVTRFGIHTGEVIVGNIGTEERINYTVIGDSVNVASRLEGINKEYSTSIMISEVVYEKIGPKFVTRPIDFVAVKGKRNKLRIFELIGMTDGELAATPEQIQLSKLFTQAYELFEEGNVKAALDLFLEIEKAFPFDGPTKKYIDRLQKSLKT